MYSFLLMLKSGRAIYPEKSFKARLKLVVFLLKLIYFRRLLSPFFHAVPHGSLDTTLNQRPDALGIVEWPYINNGWSLSKRISVIKNHHDVVEQIPLLNFTINNSLQLTDLSTVFPGLMVVCDRPRWFLREGELCINLFVNDERVYSLAFTISVENNFRVAYVGAVQGRNISNIQDLYQNLTKALFGCRPRDFLINVFIFLCNAVNITKIYGVSDLSRHHRHDYFKSDHKSGVSSNYDEIWLDRGAILSNDGFYSVPVAVSYREEADIPAKKRSMYRQRYSILKKISAEIYRLFTLN
jgi:uncharacterized protein VirK/YbjX